jgi:hypothetical protein
MSLVLQSSGGGSVTIAEPTTASDFTQTLPAADGVTMVSGNMPAFSAFQSVAQTGVSNTTFTKVTFTSEEFDTNNNFASSTFTPTVAGYYQVNACVTIESAVNNTGILSAIYKNGSLYKMGSVSQGNGSANPQGATSVLVYLNGSTDYVEVYLYGTAGGSFSTSAASTSTYFQAVMVRAA